MNITSLMPTRHKPINLRGYEFNALSIGLKIKMLNDKGKPLEPFITVIHSLPGQQDESFVISFFQPSLVQEQGNRSFSILNNYRLTQEEFLDFYTLAGKSLIPPSNIFYADETNVTT
mgnify:CR=1 FL=1